MSAADSERTAAVDNLRPEMSTERVTMPEILNAILKRMPFVVTVTFFAMAGTAIAAVLVPSKYTATTMIVPEGPRRSQTLPTGLAGLASQFGIDVPDGTASPRFYATILRSRTMMDQLLVSHFPEPTAQSSSDSAILLDILGVKGTEMRERLDNGRKVLQRAISIKLDEQSNVITLSVETPYRTLSANLANGSVSLLNRFNLETRQSSARERRRFAEERVAETEGELRNAEESLRRFLQENRTFDNSSELRFQHDRLQRQVTIKQEVLITLRRQYEEARIQEVNDTPLVTVIDGAVPPQRRSSPRTFRNMFLAVFLGTVLGLAGALGHDYVERLRKVNPHTFQELESHWHRIRERVRPSK